jgi:hypothetical protein
MDSVECAAQLTRNFRDCSCRPHDWAVGVAKWGNHDYMGIGGAQEYC